MIVAEERSETRCEKVLEMAVVIVVSEVRPIIVVNTREMESETETNEVLDRMNVRMREMKSVMLELVT